MKILKAWWHENSTICVAFSYDWLQLPSLDVKSEYPLPSYNIERAPKRLFGKYCSYFIDGDFAHFILSAENFCNVSLENAEYYLCSSFNGWTAAIGDKKWRMRPSKEPFELELKIDTKLIDLSKGGATFKFASADGRWLEPRAESPNVERDSNGNQNFRIKPRCSGDNLFFIRFSGIPDIRTKLKVCWENSCCDVDAAELLYQIYSPKRLGAYLVDGVTEFSIFAPRAQLTAVSWYTREYPEQRHILPAQTADGAVWTARAEKNLQGCYYFWHILGANIDSGTDFNSKMPLADPYANAMLTSNGPSIVVYDECLPKAKCHVPPSWHDLVVMEIHLRDVLANANIDVAVDYQNGFAALAKWLESPDCYLRKVGVNCVELQPIQEFTAHKKDDYEWGYMPVNWFAPSSSYASNAYEASQIEEFAQLVQAFHKADISVILDVVYNHFGEPNFLLKVDKEYYFEMSPDGKLTNYSGCGNDFRARSPMSSRMIIDSLKRMIVNYGVDGFRFDLAELIGVEVLREIEVELKKIKPSVILIAEPWSFRGHIAMHLRDTGFASWNDGFREYVYQFAKGDGDLNGFKHFVAGSIGGVAKWPAQTVNYIESHDDMCFFDRLCGANWKYPSIDDVRRYKLAYALVLISLGIPMVAEGFDLLRTKNGKNNTYKDGAANALDYLRGESFTALRQWLRSFVKFRTSRQAKVLRMAQVPKEGFLKIAVGENDKCVSALFNACANECGKKILAVFNPTMNFSKIAIGELDNFIQIADIERFNVCGLDDSLPVINGLANMPPLSFALFLEK